MQWEQGAELFLDALSSDKPTPGGGAAAAMAGAMGCALLLMAVGTTLKRKNTPATHKNSLKQWQNSLLNYREELQNLMQQDAHTYEAYMTAYRLPEKDSNRETSLQQALWEATIVPADIASRCYDVLQEIDTFKPFVAPIILSDVYCAHHLLKSALACGLENVRVNLNGLTDTNRIKKLKQLLKTFEKEIIQ